MYGGPVRDGRGRAEQLDASAPPETGRDRLQHPRPQGTASSRRALRAGGGLAVVVVLAVFAALYVTNLRISGRPALSTNDVNAIVNQKVSTAISQLAVSAAGGRYGRTHAVRAGLVVIEAQHQGAAGTEDLGTGIIVDTQGDILTALHVVKGASAIEVTFADGTTSAASIESSDPTHDIAVLTAERCRR